MPRDVCTYLNTSWSTWFHELLAATATSLPLPWETYQWLDRTLSRESLKRIIPSVDRGDGCARAVCLNGVCRPCAVTPLVLQTYRSICSLLLFLVFWGWRRKRFPISCSCANTTGDSNLMQTSITAHQVGCGLKIDEGECWF